MQLAAHNFLITSKILCLQFVILRKFVHKFIGMEKTCHNCGKTVSAETPKCVFCGTVIVVINNINITEQEVNRVIVPEGLSLTAVEGRVSIKDKIRLKKENLPQEKSKEMPIVVETKEKEVVSPEIVDIKPIIKEEIILPVEKEVIAIFPPAKAEIILPVEEKPAIEIAEKTVIEPINVPELLQEIENKDKELLTFLEEKKPEEPIFTEKHASPPPPIPPAEKELYSVSDALKEILAEEKKLMDFLQDVPAEKPPVFPEKKEEKPIIFPEKTEITPPPPKAEPLDTPILGIDKMPNNVPDKQGKPAVAWLIRHTENRKPVYYELFEGDNTLGRGDNVTPIEVDISDDKYVSRGHAWIRAFRVPGNLYVFELRDDGAKRKDKSPSMNGTYLNASMRRIDAKVAMYLQDGDTIQVGMTKLVFKIKPQYLTNQDKIFADVLDSDYTITVIF